MYVTTYEWHSDATPGRQGTDHSGVEFVVIENDHVRNEDCVVVLAGHTGPKKRHGPGSVTHFSNLKAPITWHG